MKRWTAPGRSICKKQRPRRRSARLVGLALRVALHYRQFVRYDRSRPIRAHTARLHWRHDVLGRAGI